MKRKTCETPQDQSSRVRVNSQLVDCAAMPFVSNEDNFLAHYTFRAAALRERLRDWCALVIGHFVAERDPATVPTLVQVNVVFRGPRGMDLDYMVFVDPELSTEKSYVLLDNVVVATIAAEGEPALGVLLRAVPVLDEYLSSLMDVPLHLLRYDQDESLGGEYGMVQVEWP